MLDIGKIIFKVLDDNSIVSFPIVAPEGSALPVIVYERSFSADDTKDGRGIDNNYIDIYVLSEDYKESITISLEIEDIISAIKGVVLDTTIFKSKCIAGAEMYQDGVYIQKLTFEIKTAA